MNPSPAIETRIGALISAYADRAPVEIDPMTMTRFAVASGTSRWRPVGLQSPARGFGFLLLVITALITIVAAAIVGGQPLRRPQDILVPRGFAVPFVGLPPDGAAPSAPETGELVFSFYGRVGSLELDFHRMWVYADGRLIWKSNLEGDRGEAWRSRFGASEPTTAVIEQRLTRLGVELLRSQVMATARILGPARVGEDVTEWGRPGVLWGGMTVRVADELFVAEWSDPWLPARLADPASWLPATAWADQRIGAYVPTRYAVCFWPGDQASTIDRVPEPARTLILANGTEIAGSGEPTPDCLQVTTDVAREIAAALNATRLQRVQLDVGLGYRVRSQAADGDDLIRLLPIVPHGEVVCSCG